MKPQPMNDDACVAPDLFERPGPRQGSTVAGQARKSPPDPLGRYYTPDDIALGICRRWRSHIRGQWVVDPFAGGGAWLRAAMAEGAASVEGCDLDPFSPTVIAGQSVLGDGLDYIARLRQREVVATNPPFCLAEETIRACMAALNEGRVSAVILLGRLTLLEGQARGGLWRSQPAHSAIVPASRIRWEGPGGDALNGGTDNYGSAALLWTWEPVGYGETRVAMGWEPWMEEVGPRQESLLDLGGGR